ncbi:MAG: hypothetical protein WC969_10935 [Elusimicrobiota bacterium]|jgi:hypothetical protein
MTDAPLPDGPAEAPGPEPDRLPFSWLRPFALLKRRARFAAICFLWALVILWALAWMFSGYFKHPNIRAMAKEARASDITYIQALRDPAAVSKRVRWHLTHTPGEWYYEGNHSEPVAWASGEPDLPITGQSGTPNDVTVLATVTGSDGKRVTLSFIGRD